MLVFIKVGYIHHVDVKDLTKERVTVRTRNGRMSFMKYSKLPLHETPARDGRYSEKVFLAEKKGSRYYNLITGEEIRSGTIFEVPEQSPSPVGMREIIKETVPTVYTFSRKGYTLDPAGRMWIPWQ